MRVLAFLALIGIAIALVIWTIQRWNDRHALPSAHRVTPPPLLEGHIEERATLAYGLDRGPGLLQLTESQLVFTSDAGRVLVIELLDVVGVSSTRQLPDREVAHQVLTVTTSGESYYFGVRAPNDWVRRLT